MPLTDTSRDAWIRDVSAILGFKPQVGMDFHNLLKNLACHYILEQYYENPERAEFTINVAPYGMATLRREGAEWQVTDFKLYPAFLGTLNETLRCQESNLYREQHDRALISLKQKLQQFSDERVN